MLDEGVSNFDEKIRWIYIEESCESLLSTPFVHFIMTNAILIDSTAIKYPISSVPGIMFLFWNEN